jgi:hypothetical protein
MLHYQQNKKYEKMLTKLLRTCLVLLSVFAIHVNTCCNITSIIKFPNYPLFLIFNLKERSQIVFKEI